MIEVQTDHGHYTIDADPEHVTAASGTLKIKRDNTVIAQFRNWDHWREVSTTEQEHTNG